MDERQAEEACVIVILGLSLHLNLCFRESDQTARCQRKKAVCCARLSPIMRACVRACVCVCVCVRERQKEREGKRERVALPHLFLNLTWITCLWC